MLTPTLSLENKVALITGGGAGIGRAIALAYAAAGASVVIADKIPERCDEVASSIQTQHKDTAPQALAAPCDVTDNQQVVELVDKTLSQYGTVDILVNNAGGVVPKAFKDQSATAWQRIIDLNLISMLSATSAVVPHMIANEKGGSIINVSSIEGSRAAPNFAVYGACKAGMLNFTRSMSLELADHNIRVNAISPDYTITPGLRGNVKGPVDPKSWWQPSEAQENATARRIPLGRPGVDTECANVALFLASSMSSYVTGSVIPVDGGSWASSGWIRNSAGEWTLTGDL